MKSSCKIKISSKYDKINIIMESITSIDLPENVQKDLNKLAEEYKCIGWDEEGLRMLLFKQAIKKTYNLFICARSDEDINDIIFKYLTQLNTKNKLEEFIQNHLIPEVETEKGMIQRRIEKAFIDRLPEDIRKYIEEIKNGFQKYPVENEVISITIDDIAELQQILFRSDILFSEYVYKEFLPSLNESIEKAGMPVPEQFKLKARKKNRGRKTEINWQEVNRMLRYELKHCRSKYENNHKLNKSKLAKKVCQSYNLSRAGKNTTYNTIYRYLNSDKCPSDVKKQLI